jgi:hypothetical protein
MTLFTPAIGPGMNATDCEGMTTNEECFVCCMPGFTASFHGHETDAGNVTCGTDAKFTDSTLACTPMMYHDPSAYIFMSLKVIRATASTVFPLRRADWYQLRNYASSTRSGLRLGRHAGLCSR